MLFNAGKKTSKLNRIKNSLKYLKNSNFIVTYRDGIANINFKNYFNLFKKYYSVSIVQRMLGLSKKEIDKYVGPWCFREEVMSEIGNKEFSIDEAKMALQALGGDVDSVDVEDWIEIAKEIHKLRNKRGVVYDEKSATFVSKKPENYIIKYDGLSNEQRKRIEEFAEKKELGPSRSAPMPDAGISMASISIVSLLNR